MPKPPYTSGETSPTWEKSNNFNVGVDFSFWQGKLSGAAEYYLRQTSDMLFNLPVAPSLERSLELDDVNPGLVLQEGFLVDVPSEGCAPECAPAVVGMEARRCVGADGSGGVVAEQYVRYSTLNLQGLASYNRTFNEVHNFDVMVGVESQAYQAESLYGRGSNLYMPGNWTLSNTIDNWTVGGGREQLSHRSVFGRVKYNFSDRYYATASVRADASSRFHPDHRWGTFLPKVALANTSSLMSLVFTAR